METRRMAVTFRGGALESLGQSFLYGVLALLVLPAAWGVAGLLRWWADRTEYQEGGRIAFEGRAGQVWGLFVALIILEYLPQAVRIATRSDPRSLGVVLVVTLALLPLVAAVKLPIYRWAVESMRLEPDVRLTFTAAYGGYLGWLILLFASYFTVIGWAWVAVALIRWLCGQVRGDGGYGLEFTGTGWGLLWRCPVWLVCAGLLLPIPWVLRSVYAWFTDHLVLVREIEPLG